MIGTLGVQTGYGAGAETPRADKRADAVGQQAKAVLAAAREHGVDLPRNAQGLAASAVARGLDAASLFAAQTAPAQATEPVGVPQADVATVSGDETASVAEEDAASDATTETDAVTDEVSGPGGEMISEDPALALLIDPDGERVIGD